MLYLASDIREQNPSSHTASDAMKAVLTTAPKNAPSGRLVIGASAPSMLTMIAPLLTLPANLIATSSTLDTLTLAVIVQPSPLDNFTTSWKSHGQIVTKMQSGTTVRPVTMGLTTSCMVATL